MDMEKQEYTIKFNQYEIKEEVWEVTENSKDVTDVFRRTRTECYGLGFADTKLQRVKKFESYYDTQKYTIERNATTVTKVIEIATGKDVTEDYDYAKNAALKEGASFTDLNSLEKYLDDAKYERTYDEKGNLLTVFEKQKIEKIRFEGEYLTDERETQLANLDNGIKWIYKQCSIDAFTIQSHVLFDSSDTKLGGDFVINPKNKDERGLNSLEYFAASRDTIAYIDDNFNYEGDLNDVYEYAPDGTKYAIISETAANKKILKIGVGDQIKVAKFVNLDKKPSSQNEGLTGKRHLEYYLEHGLFEYETYTICAVVKDMPTSDNLPIYFDPEDFTALTGKEELYTDVAVYVNTELERGDIDMLTDTLRRWCEEFAVVEWHNAVEESRFERESRNLEVIDAISVVILILSPIFWFFSQIMFYKRREREFELIRGMGAVEKEIKKIFCFDGLVLAAIGVISTIGFSAIGMWLIHQINMKWVSRLNISSRILYSFEMPWMELGISVALTAICGFLASMIPYRINKKRSSLTKSREFEGDD